MKLHMVKTQIVIGALTLVFGGNAWSQQAVDNVTINQIWAGAYYSGNEAAIRVFTDPGTITSSCTKSDAFIITSGALGSTVTATNLYFEQQFSMLLAAQHAQDTVNLWVSGCSADGKYPKATRVTTK